MHGVMRIDAPLAPSGAQSAVRSQRAAAGGFSSMVERGLESPRPQGAGPAALVGGLFAVDVDHDAASGRSRGLAHGHAMLDALDGVRLALLQGGLTRGRLEQLAARLRATVRPADPALARIIDDIELRVAVELAKYDVSASMTDSACDDQEARL